MSETPLQNDAGLDEIIAGFLEAEEVGRPVSPEQVIAAHPQFADELRSFFADRDLLRSAARPLADAIVARRPVLGQIRYFGDYELLEEIARGGMGVVYKARQTSLNRIVAVKMILAGHLASEVDVQRFQTEAEAAARLQHPNIVSVHEVGRHDGQCYFSMDYVEGKNLAELTGDHPLPARDAARYVAEIAAAIHHAHQQGTLHRDLKPSNVLIDAEDRARITDFGLAVRIDGDSRLTLSGQAVGTPPYMPPEQAQGKRGLIGPASDIYSLGAVLYELLTGRPPFRGATSVETVRQVIDDHPISPRLLNSSVPADIETICLKCLEKEPYRRYATAEFLADDLQRYLEGKPILARPVGRVARLWSWCRRRPLQALLSGALMLATVALIVVLATANIMITDALDQRTEALAEARLQQQATETALKAEQTALAAKQAALSARDTALKREQWQNYARGIQLVQRECEAGHLAEARKLLDECGPAELRGFEWHCLHSVCRSPLRHEWKGRIVRPTTPFTANGRLVSQIDGECHLYDAAAGRVIDRFPLPKFRNIEAVSPDGRRLALLSQGAVHRDLVILELPGGRHIRTIPVERTEFVRNVFFSRDGEQVAAVVEPRADQILGPAGKLSPRDRRPSAFRVWDVENGRSIRSTKPQGLLTPANSYKAVAFDVSNSLQLLATPEGVVDTVTGQPVIVAGEPVFAAAFNHDATLAALSTGSGLVTIWDVPSRVRLASWPVAGNVRALAFQPGSSMLAAGCTNGSIFFRDARSGHEVAPLKTGAAIRDLAFAPESGLLVSGHVPRRGETAFRVWETPPRGRMVLSGARSRLVIWGRTAAFSPDGRLVALLGAEHDVVLHDAATGAVVRRISGSKRKTSVAFSRDGTLLAASGDEGFFVWEVATGRLRTRMAMPDGATYCTQVAFSPDGKYLAGAHERGATIWELKSGSPVKSFRRRGRCYNSVRFSDDGRFLCATAEQGAGRIWNVADWSRRCRLVDALPYGGDLSPDGRVLATTGRRQIALVDTRSGKRKQTIPLMQLSRIAAFSPDGQRIATTAGRRILILDRRSGQRLLTLTGHRGSVTSLAFSRDGRRLVSAADDGTVCIWGDPELGSSSVKAGARRADSTDAMLPQR